MDGEWEPPMIDNPDYKGTWAPKQIDNPAYKGVWKHPEIDNPKYEADPELYLRKEICKIGFDLWQVKSGTIFDNVLITDDLEYAAEAAKTAKATQDGEKKMKDAQDEEERKKVEAEASASKDDEDEDDDDVDNEATGKATLEDDGDHDEL